MSRSMSSTIVGHPMKLEVKTDLNGKHVVADPNNLEVSIGDTLKISSADGSFRVVCVPWLFKETQHEVKTSEVLTFETVGETILFCYITPLGAKSELAYKVGPGGKVDGAHVIVR
jgi:plastocyanin